MFYRAWTVLLVAALAGCTTVPSGPSIAALPGTGKTLDQFQKDDLECQQYSASTVSKTPGALDYYEAQRRYDIVYVQCMYGRGHKVPVAGAYTSVPTGVAPPPPNTTSIPPPTTEKQ